MDDDEFEEELMNDEMEGEEQEVPSVWQDRKIMFRNGLMILGAGALVIFLTGYALVSGRANNDTKSELAELRQELKSYKNEKKKALTHVSRSTPSTGSVESNSGESISEIELSSDQLSPILIEQQVLERLALRREALARFETSLNALEEIHAKNKKLHTQADSKIIKLLAKGSEDGRRIGNSDELIDTFNGIRKKLDEQCKPIPGVNEIVSKANGIIVSAKLDPDLAFEFSPSFRKRIEELHITYKTQNQHLLDVTSGLSAIVLDASLIEPAEYDLQIAVDQLRGKRFTKLALENQERENAALVATNRRNAEELIKKDRELAAAKLAAELEKKEKQRLLDIEEAAETKASTAAIIDARREAELKKQLRQQYQASMPQIRSYLSPFLATGGTLRTSGKGPVSYGEILGRGALEETQSGLTQLWKLGGNQPDEFQGGTNDRPRGGFPRFGGLSVGHTRNAPVEYLEHAQALLKKFGPLLVEDELLAK